MRKAGWGCRRTFPPVFLCLEPETRLSKQKLPHQHICSKWGKENGFSLPHSYCFIK